MTEAEIQNALYYETLRKRHRLAVPNVHVLGWESDMVSVTKHDLLVEYEIKCSRSDFHADRKKIRHRILDGGVISDLERGAAYFYYVTPRDLVTAAEVPWYAGLIYSHPVMQIVKRAPKLHDQKLRDSQRRWLERSLTARYWKRRLRSLDEGENDEPTPIEPITPGPEASRVAN